MQSSGAYRLAYTPTYEMDIEAYPDGDMTSPDYKSQIWIPVVSE